jgi:hypothetical protein
LQQTNEIAAHISGVGNSHRMYVPVMSYRCDCEVGAIRPAAIKNGAACSRACRDSLDGEVHVTALEQLSPSRIKNCVFKRFPAPPFDWAIFHLISPFRYRSYLIDSEAHL